jgi:hypothetical protein
VVCEPTKTAASGHLGHLITRNLAVPSWSYSIEIRPVSLENRPMVEALLSRLWHYCHTVRIDGPSLREPQG